MSFGNLSSAYVFSHFDKDYKEIMLVPNLDFIKTTYDITLDSYSRFGTSTISLSFVKMVEHEHEHERSLDNVLVHQIP